jgi:hypothetical protein
MPNVATSPTLSAQARLTARESSHPAEVNSITEERTTKRHSVRLRDKRASGGRIAGSVLGELTAVLLDATRGSLRLRVEGRSTARRSLPAWFSAAADFEVVGIEAGSTRSAIDCGAERLLHEAEGGIVSVDRQQRGHRFSERRSLELLGEGKKVVLS